LRAAIALRVQPVPWHPLGWAAAGATAQPGVWILRVLRYDLVLGQLCTPMAPRSGKLLDAAVVVKLVTLEPHIQLKTEISSGM
jgi:hypothetical protein